MRMIRVCRGVYIHILTPLLFIVGFFTKRAETLLITYFIMLVHELAHLIAAIFLGLRPAHIAFYPFGVNLGLKNKLVPSLSDEIILYMAGPLANVLMALLGKVFFGRLAWGMDFYIKNIILCILNLLPIAPLDGGALLKRIFLQCFGYRKGTRLISVVSYSLLLLFGAFLYEQRLLRHNFSAWLFLVFLIGNAFTAKEKYNIGLLKQLMFEKKRRLPHRCRIFALEKGQNPYTLLKEFTNNRCNILLIIGENGEIEKILSEREVINDLLAN